MRLLSVLGYAGLLPFIGFTALQLWPQLLTLSVPFSWFQSYSQIILAFMAGVLWPVLYQNSSKLLPLWVVSFALLGWFSTLAQPATQLLLLAAAFITLRLFELTSAINTHYAPSYRRLRNHLTTVVVLCHLLYWWSF